MKEVQITPEAIEVITKDAESTYPYECCGFMYGTDDEQRLVTLAIPVENTKEENKERRFEISPLEYMRAERYADENDLILLGVYHSHPKHPAIPSEHDLRQAVPYFSYVITSVMEGKVAVTTSWRLNDSGQFEEEKVAQLQSEIKE